MSRTNLTGRGVGCEPWSLPDFERPGGLQQDGVGAADPKETQTAAAAREQGFEAGRLEGLEAGRQEAQQQVQRLQQLLGCLSRPLAELDREVEDELVALSLAIVRKLVHIELKTSPESIAAVVRESLSLLPGAQRDISLVLHPEDAQLLEELMPSAARENTWTIVEDESMARGGCMVKTRASQIDASVQARLDNIIDSFFNADVVDDPQS